MEFFFLLGVLYVCSSLLFFEFFILAFFFFCMVGFSGSFWFYQLFSLDKISFFMLLLVLWFYFILVFCSLSYKKNTQYFFYSSTAIFVLMVLLGLCFSLYNLMGFYVFFEFSLIPLIYMIMSLGYQVERISSSFYLFFYTAIGSFPLFLVLLFYFSKFSLHWISYFSFKSFSEMSFLCMVVILLAFFIKLPTYVLHLWLPKAHVEAPAVGSMVLAAILLKLSAYGLLRLLWISKSFISLVYFWLIFYLLWGALLSAILCVVQADTKSLIAYSSVSHMGVMLVGVFCFSDLSLWAVWLVAISHAFVSSLLFFLTGLNYQVYLSRQVFILRGQANHQMLVALMWILGLVANFSVPPFLGLLGELSLIWVLFSLDFAYLLVLMMGLYFVSYYCVYLLSLMAHGRSWNSAATLSEMEVSYLSCIVHLLPVLSFSIKSGWFF